MRGNPKYSIGDVVRFDFSYQEEKREKEGVVEIVDRCGTFFDDSDVSYDIFIAEENMLYKHVSEKCVVEKVRTARPEERLR